MILLQFIEADLPLHYRFQRLDDEDSLSSWLEETDGDVPVCEMRYTIDETGPDPILIGRVLLSNPDLAGLGNAKQTLRRLFEAAARAGITEARSVGILDTSPLEARGARKLSEGQVSLKLDQSDPFYSWLLATTTA